MLKKLFNKKNICLECQEFFNKDTDNKNFLSFTSHLKTHHGMSNEEYYRKYYLKNSEGLCACGCGNKTTFHKGKYLKYFSDHKNYITQTDLTLLKIKKSKEKYNKISSLLKKTGITFDELKKTYDEFINLEKPISVLSKDLSIDFRTLKDYWLKVGLIENKEIFKRTCLKSQTKWLNKPLVPNDNIVENLRSKLFLIKELLNRSDKVTFNQIITVIDLKLNKNYLGWFLKENLTSTELKKVKFIKHSQIEIDFLNLLKFYFDKSVLGSFELDGKIFDYKLGKNILIELDGEYWHSSDETKINDKLKNEIAKSNGFTLIRVNDKHVKSLDFLNNLKNIYEKIKKI
jgi:very-short-patch-repair endonuclease